MTRQTWTTEAEREWLAELIPSFLEAQENKTTTTFWPEVYKSYADKFPITPPMADEIKAANGNEELATRQKTKVVQKVHQLYLILSWGL